MSTTMIPMITRTEAATMTAVRRAIGRISVIMKMNTTKIMMNLTTGATTGLPINTTAIAARVADHLHTAEEMKMKITAVVAAHHAEATIMKMITMIIITTDGAAMTVTKTITKVVKA